MPRPKDPEVVMWSGQWRITVFPNKPAPGRVYYADQQVCMYFIEDEKGREVLEVYREDTGQTSWAYHSTKRAGRNPKGRLVYIEPKGLTRRIKNLVAMVFRYREQEKMVAPVVVSTINQ